MPKVYIIWFTYIILCEDQSHYIGSSNNVNKRFQDHLNGRGGRYTRSRKPLKLTYQEEFSIKSDALKREAELKKWSKAKKQELVQNQTFSVI